MSACPREITEASYPAAFKSDQKPSAHSAKLRERRNLQELNLRGEDHRVLASEKNLTGPNDVTRQTAAPLLQKILGEMKCADHAGIVDVPRSGDWPIDQADGSRPVRKPRTP
jgi:hypothetical protein